MKHAGQNVFENTDSLKIKRSGFDLSHEYKTTHDFFDIIPISVVEAIPGDVHKIGVSGVLRFQPMLAPILHRIKMRFNSFFVPYRLLDVNWENFITRNPDGDGVVALPVFDPDDYGTPANVYAAQSLWDYFTYPLLKPAAAACPLDYPRRAYFKIFNDFFRDENLETEIDYLDTATNSFSILKSAWARDLYTSCLPFRQKGTSPALPVFGSTSVTFTIPFADMSSYNQDQARIPAFRNGDGSGNMGLVSGTVGAAASGPVIWQNSPASSTSYWDVVSNNNTIDGTSMTSGDIADLRLAWQVQAWMERNARSGSRYVEFLQNQFGTSPIEEILQRPAFIGGLTSDVLISEVLQTGEAGTTPQGTMAGHGVGIANGMIGSYRVKEFGLIMTFATVVPTPAYMQGIDRAWLRRTTYDFPFPIFAGLSEQEVYNAEVYTLDQTADPTGATNFQPFGYTGRYNELRYQPNKVSSQMRTVFDYWHLARKFASAPALNAAFIRPNAAEITELKRIFAVPSEPGLICSYGINLQSYRPIPYMAVPSSLGGL